MTQDDPSRLEGVLALGGAIVGFYAIVQAGRHIWTAGLNLASSILKKEPNGNIYYGNEGFTDQPTYIEKNYGAIITPIEHGKLMYDMKGQYVILNGAKMNALLNPQGVAKNHPKANQFMAQFQWGNSFVNVRGSQFHGKDLAPMMKATTDGYALIVGKIVDADWNREVINIQNVLIGPALYKKS